MGVKLILPPCKNPSLPKGGKKNQQKEMMGRLGGCVHCKLLP